MIKFKFTIKIDYENDQDLLIIAYKALKNPLTENWKRAIIKNSQEVLYINLEDQKLHTYSPIDEVAILHYRKQKEQLAYKQNYNGNSKTAKNSEQKIPPRAKNLSPLGKGEKSKKKKLEKLNLGNINSDKKSVNSSEYISNRQNDKF